jgi:hypothetical protein
MTVAGTRRTAGDAGLPAANGPLADGVGPYNPSHYAGSHYVYAGISPCTTPLTVHFVEALDSEPIPMKYPVECWVLVNQLDEDGRILNAEILPGFFEPDDLQQVVTPADWCAFYGPGVGLVGVYPAGKAPLAHAVDSAWQNVQEALARYHAQQLGRLREEWKTADEERKQRIETHAQCLRRQVQREGGSAA